MGEELSCVQIHLLELKLELGFKQINGKNPYNDEHAHLTDDHVPLSWLPLFNITTQLWRTKDDFSAHKRGKNPDRCVYPRYSVVEQIVGEVGHAIYLPRLFILGVFLETRAQFEVAYSEYPVDLQPEVDYDSVSNIGQTC